MRVIAGSARRLPLKTIDGLETRPTTDRIKETLFNILQNDIYDTLFLDLFGGSGGIGIEALSRGARRAVFAESNHKAAACIRENLITTKLEDKSAVMDCDALTALRKLEGKGQVFDIIFMDPPYDAGLEKQVLEYLSESELIDDNTLIIIETSLGTDFDYLDSFGFLLKRIKQYKTNEHVFITKGVIQL